MEFVELEEEKDGNGNLYERPSRNSVLMLKEHLQRLVPHQQVQEVQFRFAGVGQDNAGFHHAGQEDPDRQREVSNVEPLMFRLNLHVMERGSPEQARNNDLAEGEDMIKPAITMEDFEYFAP